MTVGERQQGQGSCTIGTVERTLLRVRAVSAEIDGTTLHLGAGVASPSVPIALTTMQMGSRAKLPGLPQLSSQTGRPWTAAVSPLRQSPPSSGAVVVVHDGSRIARHEDAARTI